MCPTYDYWCKDCDLEEELLVHLDELDKEFKCASCGEPMKRKSVNDIPFHLKGNGWARDGYSRTVGDMRKHISKEGKTYKSDEDGNGRVE